MPIRLDEWITTAEATLRTVQRLAREEHRLVAALHEALGDTPADTPDETPDDAGDTAAGEDAWVRGELARMLGDVAGLQQRYAALVEQVETILLHARAADHDPGPTVAEAVAEAGAPGRRPMDAASLGLFRNALRETQAVLLQSGAGDDEPAKPDPDEPSELADTLTAALALNEAVEHERTMLAAEADAARELLAQTAERLASADAAPTSSPEPDALLGRIRDHLRASNGILDELEGDVCEEATGPVSAIGGEASDVEPAAARPRRSRRGRRKRSRHDGAPTGSDGEA